MSVKEIRKTVDPQSLTARFEEKLRNGFAARWLKFCARVSAWAQLKGWRSSPRGIMEFNFNATGELAEAWEEFRKQKLDLYFSEPSNPGKEYDNSIMPEVDLEPGRFKPEGFWVELADLVIRLADTITEFELPNTLNLGLFEDTVANLDEHGGLSLMRGLSEVKYALRELDQCEKDDVTFVQFTNLTTVPCDVVVACFTFAEIYDVDLWSLLDLKMRYNDTRAARHGGKVA